MLELGAPYIRARSKTHGDDLEVARAIAAAAQIYAGDPIDLVVGHRRVGLLWGDDTTSTFLPISRFSGNILYDTDDEAVKKRSLAAGNWPIFFSKFGGSRTNTKWWDLWSAGGTPTPGDFSGTARTARAFTKSTKGGAMFPDCTPSRRFITRMSTMSLNRYNFVIPYDRVLSYDACSFSASSQSMTNTTAAPRWISAGQRGLKASCWIDTTNGTGTANLSALVYTTVGGTGSRTILTTPALTKAASLAGTSTRGAQSAFTSAVGVVARPFFELQAASDIGIKTIDSYQWSAAPTGSACFTLTQPYYLQVMGSQVSLPGDDDLMSGLEAYENMRLYDDTCLSYLWWVNTTAQSTDMMWIDTGVS